MFFYHVHFHKIYQLGILFPPSNIFSGKIVVAPARNHLNMLVIVSEGIQEWNLICTFVIAGLLRTSSSYIPSLFFILISRKFENFSSFSSFTINWMCLFIYVFIFYVRKDNPVGPKFLNILILFFHKNTIF